MISIPASKLRVCCPSSVLTAGGCELKTREKIYRLSAPKVVRDHRRRRFPFPVRLVLVIVGAGEYMELSIR